MIEDKEAAWDHKEHLGQMEIIILRGWDFRFEKLDRFVAKKTDSAARKTRQFRVRDELVTRHQRADFTEWIRRRVEATLGVALDNPDLPVVTLDNEPGLGSDERESPRYVIFFGRFKEKTVTAVIKFLER
jgi:hypothetical protein